MCVDMIGQAYKETVLVKLVIQDLFSEVDVYFIIGNKGKSFIEHWFICKRELEQKVITHPKIKSASLPQC